MALLECSVQRARSLPGAVPRPFPQQVMRKRLLLSSLVSFLRNFCYARTRSQTELPVHFNFELALVTGNSPQSHIVERDGRPKSSPGAPFLIRMRRPRSLNRETRKTTSRFSPKTTTAPSLACEGAVVADPLYSATLCFSGAAVPMPSGFPASQSIPQPEWSLERHW